jgi:hypothetical protein
VHLAAAKRWVPWLCAFTGAPITDITSVRKEDFRREGSILVLRLFGTRSRAYRDIPINPQLVELGFEQFLAGARAGPLLHKQEDLAGRRQRQYPKSLAGGCGRLAPTHTYSETRAGGIASARSPVTSAWMKRSCGTCLGTSRTVQPRPTMCVGSRTKFQALALQDRLSAALSAGAEDAMLVPGPAGTGHNNPFPPAPIGSPEQGPSEQTWRPGRLGSGNL